MTTQTPLHPEQIRILLIEDDPADRFLFQETLYSALHARSMDTQYIVEWAATVAEGIKKYTSATQPFHIIVSDLLLADAYGSDTITQVMAIAQSTPVVLLSGVNDERLALEAIHHGVQDYLIKGEFDGVLLKRTLHYAIERKRMEQRQSVLASITPTIHQIQDVHSLLEQICQLAFHLVPATLDTLLVLNRGLREGNVEVYLASGDGEKRKAYARALVEVTRHVITHKQPVFSATSDSVALGLTTPSTPTIGAYVGIPLLINGEGVGVLYVLERESRSYSTLDIGFLTTLANRAAAAVAEGQMLVREQEERKLTYILRQMTGIVNSSLALSQVLERTLICLKEVVPYHSAMIMLVEDGQLRIRAAQGMLHPKALSNLKVVYHQHPIFTEMIQLRQPMIVDDVRRDARFRGFIGSNYERSWLGVPLMLRNDVLGFLTIDHANPQAYGPREAEIIFAVANQAVAAIKNARLFEQLQGALAHTDALYSAAQALLQPMALDDVLTSIVDAMIAALDCEQAQVILLDGHGEVEDRKWSESKSGLHWDAIDEWLKRTLCNGEAICTMNAQADRPIGSVMVVPLHYHDKTLGALGVINRLEQRTFTHADVKLLVALASQAAIAVENARLFEEAQRLANMDELTGIYNRRSFFMQSERIFQQHQRAPHHHQLSALMLDIDHFKMINDRYGHVAGDRVLQLVAQRIESQLRPTDIMGRYGGEEFVILLPHTDDVHALLLGEQIRQSISSTPIVIDGESISISVSVGGAESNGEAKTLLDLLNMADQSLYRAKQSGRNRTILRRAENALTFVVPGAHVGVY